MSQVAKAPVVRSLLAVALLLVLEGSLISVHVRDPELNDVARWGVAFASFFLILAYPRARNTFRDITGRGEPVPVSWGFLLLQLLFALTVFFSPALAGTHSLLFTIGWTTACAGAFVLAALAFVPFRIWRELLRPTGRLWIYAALVAAAASLIAPWLWSVWDRSLVKPATDATFGLVKLMLEPVLPGLISDRAALTIGSAGFTVMIGGQCSGWEGAGLALLFSSVWLWVFRRDYRFPRALVVIPAGVVIMFLLNSVRIAALILIGHAGATRVAMGGFHSQAGWIAFNLVALGISWLAPRIRWLTVERADAHPEESEPNPTVPYLLPFSAILAAGMISRSVSADFEWLYPLRFAAAAGVLWICRRSYSSLRWKVGWMAPLGGAAVFLLWMTLDRGASSDNGISRGLAGLQTPSRIAWLAFRTIAAVVTVPLAEELAFRGFLLRRLISSDFELVDPRRFTSVSLIGSSLAFGLMHGDRWVAGTIAGLVYGLVTLRRGSIGDAVVAHATTNALLAAWVLIGGAWYLW